MKLTLLMALLAAFWSSAASQASEIQLDKIRLPQGFKIEVYAAGVPNARSLTLGPKGIIFVGSRGAGNVYAITPDHKVHLIAHGLNMPNGVAYRDGSLYVAEISRILKFGTAKDPIENHLDDSPKYSILNVTYPTDEHHGWKFIAFGPDGDLYIPQGAPCNICNPDQPIYASITRIKPDGSQREIYAHGVRNTVGFDWDPETRELWFTDNGRDMLGDDSPPDKLNHAPRSGMNFGFPYCHGGDIPDPEFGSTPGKDCSHFTPPVQKLGPHVASLGMRFYTGKMFPREYQHQIFIAEHGSWNRSVPIGYRVTTVTLDSKGNALSYKPFADGWLQKNGKVLGRPVDVLVMPDGALLVSDDYTGVVYRISYP